MKALVFGANGYIGKHLTQYLYHIGFDLECFDIQENLSLDIPITYTSLNLVDKKMLNSVNFQADFLFYFMGLTGTENSFEMYEEFLNINEIGFLNILTSVSKYENKPKIIFPSTRLIYKGKDNSPLSENSEKEFKTIYAINKYSGEKYLEMFHNFYGINYSIFRICVPYGNIFDSNYSYGTIGFFLNMASQNKPIVLFGDGKLRRTFTHVNDICKQIVEVSLMKNSDGECFNIKGENFSLFEVATIISLKYNIGIKFVEWPQNYKLLESGDTIFNSEKIEKIYQNDIGYSLKEWLNGSKNES